MIRKAKNQDVEDIMNFIDTNWKKGHILGVNRSFFEYEHADEKGINFVISVDEKDDIEAILGYIPYAKEKRDVMTVMWMAKHTSNPMLGIELLEYLIKECDVRIVASPGINKKTIAIYKFLGYKTGCMKQYYRLNMQCKNFKIARIISNDVPKVKQTENYELIEMHTYSEFEKLFDFESYKRREPKPFKEKWYIKKRYFNHPIYQYKVYGVKNKGRVDTVLVMREVEAKERKILRIVDILGEYSELQYTTKAIDCLLTEGAYEYIDLYETGLDDDMLKKSGFVDRTETDNIIPNYFEPYLQENIDINYFTTDADIVLFKGDGDQDRPSVVREVVQ